MYYSPSGLRVGSAGKLGRGVFATKEFGQYALIERAPVLIVEDKRESVLIEQLTVLGSYVYAYDENTICLALGFASLYNHSFRPNAEYCVYDEWIDIIALRDIKAGAQIKINYNGNPKDRTPIDWAEWERT